MHPAPQPSALGPLLRARRLTSATTGMSLYDGPRAGSGGTRQDMTQARAIYQANLDAVSEAIMTGDLHLLRRHIAIPIMLYGPASEVVVSSIEEMEILISDYRAQLIAKGFTAYRRHCLTAQVQPGPSKMIVGRHRTEIMAGLNHIVPPYDCTLALMRIDGAWMAVWEQVEDCATTVEFLSPDMTDAQKRAHAALAHRAASQGGQPPKGRV